ncbi:hypothetical protein CEXT_660501 [Caerostris extrusa]|uniref:Uncharacterized protein n=1 Tax=Caerostris extrusa TaxID=172846 RepID=A0AAV4QQK2_CAEEX|nr:hypothetical protein CEXT_660501 [Caerostris extrusa]
MRMDVALGIVGNFMLWQMRMDVALGIVGNFMLCQMRMDVALGIVGNFMLWQMRMDVALGRVGNFMLWQMRMAVALGRVGDFLFWQMRMAVALGRVGQSHVGEDVFYSGEKRTSRITNVLTLSGDWTNGIAQCVPAINRSLFSESHFDVFFAPVITSSVNESLENWERFIISTASRFLVDAEVLWLSSLHV